MAILFFEGLPRAGKSYEAMVTQIIPWLKKGKHVVAYIEGLDFERIAQAAELDVETVREYLHPLTRGDMQPREAKTADGKTVKVDGAWIDKVRDNALHVYDEAQNWWGNKTRATDELTQFVSEHGHRGMTILLMGQSLKDVLALWRRRVDQKLEFLKLSALGSKGAKRYQVTVFKGMGDEKFAKVTAKINRYDEKYFGTYASHVSDETDTDTYTDARVNVWNSSLFRWVIPSALVIAIWGGWTAYKFFYPDKPKPGSSTAALASPPPVAPGAKTASAAVPAPVQPVPAPEVVRSAEERYMVELTEKGRARLGGFIQGKGRRFVVVEWLDSGTRVMERLNLEQLGALGVAVELRGSTVKLSLGGWSQIVTMWPVEADGRVSEYENQRIKALARDGGSVEARAVASPGLVFIDGGKAPLAPPAAPVQPEQQPQRIASVKR